MAKHDHPRQADAFASDLILPGSSSSRASRRQTGAMLEAEAKFKGEKRQKQARF
jgi:hypothetical protein